MPRGIRRFPALAFVRKLHDFRHWLGGAANTITLSFELNAQTEMNEETVRHKDFSRQTLYCLAQEPSLTTQRHLPRPRSCTLQLA